MHDGEEVVYNRNGLAVIGPSSSNSTHTHHFPIHSSSTNMKFSHALTALALTSGVVADCPPEQRIDALKYIVRAFNAVGLESVQLINGMPLAPQCDAFL